ncbi:MAG: heme exporter protein CcmD [Chloroflexi bacterium]|nr:heme exporter protein CcmD [Chloroflexota bacterium]
MIPHVLYVLAAYTVVWLVLLAYLFTIARRQASIRRELEELQRTVAHRQSPGGSGPPASRVRQ